MKKLRNIFRRKAALHDYIVVFQWYDTGNCKCCSAFSHADPWAALKEAVERTTRLTGKTYHKDFELVNIIDMERG